MTAPAPAPGRRGRPGRPARAGLACGLLAAALAAPGAPGAQDRPPGIRLSLDVSESLEYDSNLRLTPGGEDATAQATTNLSFGLLSETPIQSLALTARATLRLADGPTESGVSFDGPRLSFEYGREAADASLTARGSFAQDDVAFLRGLEDFINEDGVLELPEDFDDLEGSGTRRDVALNVALTLRQQAPFGVTLSAGLRDLSYGDVTSDELEDNRRLTLGAAFRLTLSPAAEATAALRYSIFDEDGEEGRRDTLGLDAGLSVDRPLGQVFGRLSIDDTESGTRTSISVGRSRELPLGALSGSLGVARDASGDLDLVGDLSLSRRFRDGSASLSASQQVRQGDDDEEQLSTSLAATYRRDLTPRAGLALDALYGDQRSTGGGGGTRSLSLGASTSYALTEDWSLSAGVRRRMEDEEGEGRAHSNSVFLSVSRSFEGGL